MLFLWMNTRKINTFGWFFTILVSHHFDWFYHPISNQIHHPIFYFTALFLSNTLQLNITKISHDCKIVNHGFSAFFFLFIIPHLFLDPTTHQSRRVAVPWRPPAAPRSCPPRCRRNGPRTWRTN